MLSKDCGPITLPLREATPRVATQRVMWITGGQEWAFTFADFSFASSDRDLNIFHTLSRYNSCVRISDHSSKVI